MKDEFCQECGTEFKTENQRFCSMCGAPTNPGGQAGNYENELAHSARPGVTPNLPDFVPLERTFQREDFSNYSEGAFSFLNANRTIVQAAARSWFPGKYRTATELTSHIQGEVKPEWISDFEVNDWFLDGEDFFSEYEAISWENSIFGDRFLKCLDRQGVGYSKGSLGARVEVELPDGTIETLPISTQIELVSGQWSLSDGTRYIQKGELFKSKRTGKETVYWNVDAYASTRPRTSESNIAFSSGLLIPHQLQVATYLAETDFPSGLGGMVGIAKREKSFGENIERFVRPVTRHIVNGRIIGLEKGDVQTLSIATWAPDVWQHGYVFDDSMTDEEIFNQLPTVSNGLSKINEILVDGYCNWPLDTDLDFQLGLWTDWRLCAENDYYRNGAIIPGVLYWELAQRSNARYDQAYNAIHQDLNEELRDQGFDALMVLLYEGVGSIFLHAGNTWASFGIEAYEDFDCSSELQFLSTIDVDSQGINALSNLILWHIQNGTFEKSEPLVDIALNSTDHTRPNLETHSHFHPLDGSVEVSIIVEIFESALTVKRELGKKEEVRKIARKAIEFCEKHSPDSQLLFTAQELLK